MEKETGKKVFSILQLRHHPAIIDLRKKVQAAPASKRFQIKLDYITPRGNWYRSSWKGNPDKSGGIATNIGLHFFDMLLWIFGKVKTNTVREHLPSTASGFLQLEKADVEWQLSIESSGLPQGKKSHRSLIIDGETVEFSEGFSELHNIAYREILGGNGFGLDETRPGIQLVHDIRNFKQA
jgi:UDP-N-acetyl-2-amino-2-deoxyglucuronate dehydrogenase